MRKSTAKKEWKKTEEKPDRAKDYFKNGEEKAEEEMTFSNGQN